MAGHGREALMRKDICGRRCSGAVTANRLAVMAPDVCYWIYWSYSMVLCENGRCVFVLSGSNWLVNSLGVLDSQKDLPQGACGRTPRQVHCGMG